MSRFFFIILFWLQPIITEAQSLRPEIRTLADSIAQHDRLDMFFIGSGSYTDNSGRMARLINLATTNELLELLQNQNTTIKNAAFQCLCTRDSVDIPQIVLDHLYDTSLVQTQMGCIVYTWMTGDYFLHIYYLSMGTKDANYFMENYSKFYKIDSLLFYDPAIRLEAKEGKIKSVNGDSSRYDRLREIAINERIPVSVLALAKFRKQQDINIIESYFADKKSHYYAIWAVREFPDSAFYPMLLKVFENNWKSRNYDYRVWRILYQALAQYPNEKTFELFDRTINAKNTYRRETLCRFLTIAVTKYPNPEFEKYKNRANVDTLHAMFLDEEMRLEE